MDNNDSSNSMQNAPARHRRPLPQPTPSVPPVTHDSIPPNRPNTPIQHNLSPSRPSSPKVSTIKNSSDSTPSIPIRPKGVGSSHTTAVIIPDETNLNPNESEKPPSYFNAWNGGDEFRDAEVIHIEDRTRKDDASYWANPDQEDWPATTPFVDTWGIQKEATLGWDTKDSNWGTTSEPIDWNTSGLWEPTPFVKINGRDNNEELAWWNSDVREKAGRPGPGMLSTRLADRLHDANHTIFSVVVPKNPNFPEPLSTSSSSAGTTPAPTGTLNATPTPSGSASPPPSSSSSKSERTLDPHSPPPSLEDARMAIPHPNAYYCPKENGWVLLLWKSSSVDPPFARSFLSCPEHSSVPPLARRRRVHNCLADMAKDLRDQENLTHHFHTYPRSIDALKLSPCYQKDEWETKETVKRGRRGGTFLTQPVDLQKMKEDEEQDKMDSEEPEEGLLLDLHVCCQCCFYVISSEVISGVLERSLWEAFIKDKMDNPTLNHTPESSVVIAVETLLL
jgi:ubiquitin carboxyl-terminal hydrolase 25